MVTWFWNEQLDDGWWKISKTLEKGMLSCGSLWVCKVKTLNKFYSLTQGQNDRQLAQNQLLIRYFQLMNVIFNLYNSPESKTCCLCAGDYYSATSGSPAWVSVGGPFQKTSVFTFSFCFFKKELSQGKW